MKKNSGNIWKVGLFVITGIAIFTFFIYFIGKQKNLFGSNIRLKSEFRNVSGLKIGNQVRLSGINVGTVDDITMISDSSVMVEMIIRKSVQQFIQTDTRATIGSDGLMGDKVLTLVPGPDSTSAGNVTVKDNDTILSSRGVEMEDIMQRLKGSVDNAAIITRELATFTVNMNNKDGLLNRLIADKDFSNKLNTTLTHLEGSAGDLEKFTKNLNSGKGALAKLVTDESFGNALDSTMMNLQSGTKGLSENMEAAQHNFLLRGFFNKKKKADAKKADELEEEENMRMKAREDSISRLPAKQAAMLRDSTKQKR